MADKIIEAGSKSFREALSSEDIIVPNDVTVEDIFNVAKSYALRGFEATDLIQNRSILQDYSRVWMSIFSYKYAGPIGNELFFPNTLRINWIKENLEVFQEEDLNLYISSTLSEGENKFLQKAFILKTLIEKFESEEFRTNYILMRSFSSDVKRIYSKWTLKRSLFEVARNMETNKLMKIIRVHEFSIVEKLDFLSAEAERLKKRRLNLIAKDIDERPLNYAAQIAVFESLEKFFSDLHESL